MYICSYLCSKKGQVTRKHRHFLFMISVFQDIPPINFVVLVKNLLHIIVLFLFNTTKYLFCWGAVVK